MNPSLTIKVIGGLILQRVLPILCWAALVCLKKALDGKMEEKIDEQNQNVPYKDVSPPPAG